VDDPREIARIRDRSRRLAVAALALGLLISAAFVLLLYLVQSDGD